MVYSLSDVAATKVAISSALPDVIFYQSHGGLGLHAHRGAISCIVFQPENGSGPEIVALPRDVIDLLGQPGDVPQRASRKRDERLQIVLTQAELKELDNWRLDRRMPTRAAAVRELLRGGLVAD